MADTGDVDVAAIRSVLLEVRDGLSREYSHLQASSVLQEAVGRLANRRDLQTEQALLASFYDLFRTGYLSWGHDLANPAPPFCHVTVLGRRALAQHSRDPANPDGYLFHLKNRAAIGPVTASYIAEAVNTFNAACFKATAVMVGAAVASRLMWKIERRSSGIPSIASRDRHRLE